MTTIETLSPIGDIMHKGKMNGLQIGERCACSTPAGNIVNARVVAFRDDGAVVTIGGIRLRAPWANVRRAPPLPNIPDEVLDGLLGDVLDGEPDSEDKDLDDGRR